MRENFKKNRILKIAASFDVTIICLLLLMVLTFWGTLYQVDHGLYAAQHRMFNRWFFLVWGFIPFPGARLVLWVTFFNLILSAIYKYMYQWRKIGLLFIHYGLLLLLVSAGFTFHFAQESVLSLAEGEASNVSEDYHDWEIALWRQTVNADTLVRDGQAISFKPIQKGSEIRFENLPATVKISEKLPNCNALMGPSKPGYLPNNFNINELVPLDESADAGKNFPGVILEFPNQLTGKVLVFAGAPTATAIELEGKPAFVSLRRINHALPITLKLLDFRKTEYPGTSRPRSFESDVSIGHDGIFKDASISMNKPYREKGYTIYQASFSQSGMGETSTFAVVHNYGRILPYICCLMVGFGLILHFVLMLIQFARKKKPGKQNATK